MVSYQHTSTIDNISCIVVYIQVEMKHMPLDVDNLLI